MAMVSKKNIAPGTGRNTPRQSKMGNYAAKEMTGKKCPAEVNYIERLLHFTRLALHAGQLSLFLARAC